MDLKLVERMLNEIARDDRKRELSVKEIGLVRDVAFKMIEANQEENIKEIEVIHEYKTRRLKASTDHVCRLVDDYLCHWYDVVSRDKVHRCHSLPIQWCLASSLRQKSPPASSTIFHSMLADMNMKQTEAVIVVVGFLTLAAVLIITTGKNDIFASGVLILLILLFGFMIMMDSIKTLQLQYDDEQPAQCHMPTAHQLTYFDSASEDNFASPGLLHVFFSVLFTTLLFGMTTGFDAHTGMATALSVVSVGHRRIRLWHYYNDKIDKCIPVALLIDVAGVLAATKANIGVATVICLAAILIVMFELNLQIEEAYRTLVFATMFIMYSQRRSNFEEAGSSVAIAFTVFTTTLGVILLYDKIDERFRTEVRRSILRMALAFGANILTEEVCGFSGFPVLTVSFVIMLYFKSGQGMLMWVRASRATGFTLDLGTSYNAVFSDVAVATMAAGNAFFRRGIENFGIIYSMTYMFGFTLYVELFTV